MVKKLFLFIIFSSYLYSNSFFDKFYIFGQYAAQKESAIFHENYEKYSGGLFFDKSFHIEEINTKVLSSIAIKNTGYSIENNDTQNGFQGYVKNLYMISKYGNFDISIGRQYIDLATARISSVNSFLSKKMSVMDFKDKYLHRNSLNGITISEKIPSLNSRFYAYMYGTNDDTRLVLNINTKALDSNLDIFAGFDKNGDMFTSLGANLLVQRAINFYLEAKYQNDKISNVLGLDYSMPNGIAFAAEHLIKNDKYDTVSSPISPSAGNIVNGLKGGKYWLAYLRLPIENISLNALIVNNRDDFSTALATEAEIKFNYLKLYGEFIVNMGSSGSEFSKNYANSFRFGASIDLIHN